MSEMFGCDLVTGDYSSSQIVHASQVAISIVYDRVKIRLALGIDAGGTEALVTHLLGGDNRPEAVADALRELANVAAGAFKRAALTDGASVAIGIPSDQNLFATGEGRRWTLRGKNSVSLAFAGIARSIPPKRIPASKLEEGMVVIRDSRHSLSGRRTALAGWHASDGHDRAAPGRRAGQHWNRRSERPAGLKPAVLAQD
jgi:hypothetical protein